MNENARSNLGRTVGIEDPIVIKKTPDHLKDKAETHETAPLPESRAPQMSLFV